MTRSGVSAVTSAGLGLLGVPGKILALLTGIEAVWSKARHKLERLVKAAVSDIEWWATRHPDLNHGAPDRSIGLDHVEDAEPIPDLIPSGKGLRVILTTTNRGSAFGTQIEVGVYEEDQAIDILCKATKIDDQAGHAIEMLGSTRDQYLERLGEPGLVQPFRARGDDPYLLKVNVVLHIAHPEFTRKPTVEGPALGRAAPEVLWVMALLAESGVPRVWLASLSDIEDAAQGGVDGLLPAALLDVAVRTTACVGVLKAPCPPTSVAKYLDVATEVLGAGHPDALVSCDNLACAHKLAEARGFAAGGDNR